MARETVIGLAKRAQMPDAARPYRAMTGWRRPAADA